MSDHRYESPIAGVSAEQLPAKMRAAADAAGAHFPAGTGIAVFVFDRSKKGGGFGWIANAVRGDMIKALLEWIAHQRGRN